MSLNVYIKRWRVKTSLSKLNIPVRSEEELMRALQDKKLINRVGNIVDNPRVLLCCYMIVHYPKNILSIDVFDYYLKYKAQRVLEVLEALKQNYSWSCFVLFQWRFLKFQTYFNSWKQKDLQKLCIPIVHEYWELNALKEKYTHLTHEYQVIEGQQQMVLNRLRRIHKNVDDLLERYKDNAPTLEETVAESFYQRWIKDLYYDLVDEKYERVVPLVEDVKNMINRLVPNNERYQQQIIQRLDIDLLRSMVENTNIEGEYVHNMIMFVMNTIRELESADMDEDTDTVIVLLQDMFVKQFSYAQILTFFFQSAFQKLELINKRKLEFMKQVSK